MRGKWGWQKDEGKWRIIMKKGKELENEGKRGTAEG